MLTISSQPPAKTTTGSNSTFALHNDQPSTLLARIIDSTTHAHLLFKCFMGVTDCRFTTGYAVNRALQFRPLTAPTGFTDSSDRRILLHAECQDTAHPADIVHSPDITMYATDITLTGQPQLVTTLPDERMLRADESDEVMVAGPPPLTLHLSCKTRHSLIERDFTEDSEAVALFRINAADFPDAERIVLSAGGRQISYSPAAPLPEGRRLAWRSRTGVVEHYTFPIVHSSTRLTDRELPRWDNDGTRPSCHLTRLVSAYENRPMLEALSEIIASPQVWSVENGLYTPVKVATDRTLTHRYGVLSHLEIEIIEPDKPSSL